MPKIKPAKHDKRTMCALVDRTRIQRKIRPKLTAVRQLVLLLQLNVTLEVTQTAATASHVAKCVADVGVCDSDITHAQNRRTRLFSAYCSIVTVKRSIKHEASSKRSV